MSLPKTGDWSRGMTEVGTPAIPRCQQTFLNDLMTGCFCYPKLSNKKSTNKDIKPIGIPTKHINGCNSRPNLKVEVGVSQKVVKLYGCTRPVESPLSDRQFMFGKTESSV